MGNQDEEIRIYPNKVIMWLLCILFFPFTVGFASLVVAYGIRELGVFATVILIIGAILFGRVFIFAAKALMRKEPFLTLRKDGIVDASSLFPLGFISWHEISRVDFMHTTRNTYIRIVVKDPGQFISRQPILLRMVLRFNKLLFKDPVILPITTLATSEQVLLSHIRRLHKSV